MPQFKVSYTSDTVKIKYTLLDSIPHVFYEITDLNNNFEKTVGRAYLLYKNDSIGNFGYRVLVSDTTKYGYFIIEAIMDRDMHKQWNDNLSFEENLVIHGAKTGHWELIKVAPPCRIIQSTEKNRF